ncbi:hypothetical protein [Rhizohabitans arisaemae]|uniref:hypothetical protein n=1 Tax=Rhizohabitans arisaemae TaxID=2720610 RepID=UPI0024B1D291|nr:hypothetical protein [Rhizohabitans arisaemae]
MAGLPFGLAAGLLAWLPIGFYEWLTGAIQFSLWDGITIWLTIGLTFGLTRGLMNWVAVPAGAEQAAAPMTSWRADRTVHLVRTTVFGLTFGLAVWLAFELGFTLGFELAIWLAVWFAFGFTVGLTMGKHQAWLAYLVATYRLALTKRLPRALMPFLDDAHRLGLLRAVGPIYQFRHAELQDHLANAYERDRPKKKTSLPAK